jgi:hypothetical protein
MVDDADAVDHVGYGLTVPACALYPQRAAVRAFARFPFVLKNHDKTASVVGGVTVEASKIDAKSIDTIRSKLGAWIYDRSRERRLNANFPLPQGLQLSRETCTLAIYTKINSTRTSAVRGCNQIGSWVRRELSFAQTAIEKSEPWRSFLISYW